MIVWMLSVAAHWVVGVGFCICVSGGISHLHEDLDSGSKLSHTYLSYFAIWFRARTKARWIVHWCVDFYSEL